MGRIYRKIAMAATQEANKNGLSFRNDRNSLCQPGKFLRSSPSFSQHLSGVMPDYRQAGRYGKSGP
jgi:hypothetical protein